MFVVPAPQRRNWTSSKTKTPSSDRKTLIVKGRDVNGPTQLIISQFDNNFAAKLWDGAGAQWEAIGNIANSIRFNKVYKGKEQNCGGRVGHGGQAGVQNRVTR